MESINSFIPEGNFRFSWDGIKFKATDASQIVLVDFFMDKSVFDKYEVEPTLVGLDLTEFSRILSRAMPGDRLRMDLMDSELRLELEGDLKRSFSLPLLDISDEEVKLPKYSFDATVKISARMLRELLKDAALFSSSVVLMVSNNAFSVESRGANGNVVAVTKSKGIEIQAKGNVKSKYSLSFLQNIVKDADPDGTVTLELKSDTALRASYAIGSSRIEFYLAHMIL